MEQYRAGKTVKIICTECKNVDWESPVWAEGFIWRICSEVGMFPLITPMSAYLYDAQDNTKNGISAFLLIAESHIAAHLWTHFKSIRLVIDSCKDFELQKIINFIQLQIEPENMEVEEI